MADVSKIDLSKPRYPQDTYAGRAKHFFMLTNPMNTFASEAQLNEAKRAVDTFKKSRKLPQGYDVEKLWHAKYLVDSAYHPDTGELMVNFGRMSAQAPMNTIITGCMITFYKTTAATVFWQWINQTFNAVVNYTNRSGDAPMSTQQLLASYVGACGGALGTALYLNSKVKTMSPIYARLVPFAAVCGANFINIPMMRSGEIINGTPVFAPDGKRMGESKKAAALGISLVCLSRVFMALPGMTLTPVITSWATRKGWFNRLPKMVLPFQLLLVGVSVTVATPLGCALFPQTYSYPVNSLESGIKEKMKHDYPEAKVVTFNKGLEILNGTPVFAPDGKKIGESKKAAIFGIGLVCLSRTFMAIPGMTLTPMISSWAVGRGWFCRRPWMATPFQIALAGICVVFSTPLGCALFPQIYPYPVSGLEPDLQEKMKYSYPKAKTVLFNKGL